MNFKFFIYFVSFRFCITAFYLVSKKCRRIVNIAFGSVKETKVAKKLFSLCSISIFTAFLE